MGSQTQIDYYLPTTRVRLSCTVTTLTDTILGREALSTPGLAVELVTVADSAAPRSLVLDSGFWRDYSVKLGLTEDGLLTQAGVETTGQVGKVLAGVVALGATAAALASGGLPLLAATRAVRPPSKMGPASLQDEDKPSLADPVAAAYAQAHPEAAERLALLVTELGDTHRVTDRARKAHRDAPDAATRRAYTASKAALIDVEAEVSAARIHFETWRKSTFKEREASWDLLLSVAELPTWDGEELKFTESPSKSALQEILYQAKEILAVRLPAGTSDEPRTGTRSGSGSAAGTSDYLAIRRPHPVEMVTLRRMDGVCSVQAVFRTLIMDSSCTELRLPLRKSWFARRNTNVEFSALGALTGVELNGASSGAAATADAAALLDSLPKAIDSASKARGALQGLASAGEEAELARLKRQVDLAEQRLLSAGQAVTAADFAELARLKQQVEIAELRAELSGLGGRSSPAEDSGGPDR
ncbi:hypothetical protein SAMN02745244_02186 [Tessaracoccus bendigoensis DSM 12906]|uniref:Uncharacterized protein n=1 Tax=Tessaracoccus bendigoensis DSM 12906 TaxID=1123357 RepID=A0A1M6I7F5_9ACTN|nr:hypothetical protein [Tessaracoccus bendigoensis]SHJ30369.1 hypothetical protein SAMN02745244_02186 [Tessaracoccus bendigoensis DSM 12906]